MSVLDGVKALNDREFAEVRRYLEDRYFPDARAKQCPPAGDWYIWMLLAGRGFGKTLVGAEWIVDAALREPGVYAVVAPTFSDARDTCAEDPTSGMLAVLRRRLREPSVYNRSLGEIRLKNGSLLKCMSAEEPDSPRGKNLSGAWCDELAAWRYEETWYEGLIPAVRIGTTPRIVVTTTPKPTRLLRDLVGREGDDVHLTRGSTWENAENLSEAALAQLRLRYEGTRLGRQELEGELLDDVPGALWQRAWIDARRVTTVEGLAQVVVAVDPALTASESSDETGIVAAGSTRKGHCPTCGPLAGGEAHAFVLADESCRLSPDAWARQAVACYDTVRADRLVAEHNAGYDLVSQNIRTVRPHISYEKVIARRGKHLRAQPVAALYEQGRVHHVGRYDELEDQLCMWTPDNAQNASDDRLDALVYAITALGLVRDGAEVIGAVEIARARLPKVMPARIGTGW